MSKPKHCMFAKPLAKSRKDMGIRGATDRIITEPKCSANLEETVVDSAAY